MEKFVIECPVCGRYAEAKKGFFTRKRIECSCGYTINIRLDKMASRRCPHCGNEVIFDQSKGDKATCPVCHEFINTMTEQSKFEEVSCAQCGVHLFVNKEADTYICPVCDHVNKVAEQIVSERIRKSGLASVIKYEGNGDTFVWKHPIEDFNYGSQLIVRESQEAIFFRDGQALDLFGPGRYTLEIQQLPLMGKIDKLPMDTKGVFHSEIYYINLATVMGIKWGTDSKIRMFDPVSGLHVELGACGEFNIRVINSRRLLNKLVGTTRSLRQDQIFGTENGKGYFRALIMAQVKSYLAQTIKSSGISILEVDEHLIELANDLKERLNDYLKEYGLEMPEFFISRIMTPDDEPNFRRMKEQYAQQYLLVRQEQIRKSEAEAMAQRMTVEAQTQAHMKIIAAQGDAEALKIQKSAEIEAYRMKAEAEATEMRLKGYTYKEETDRKMGVNATNAMGATGKISELAGLGMTLGAIKSVAGLTKEAMNTVTKNNALSNQADPSTVMSNGLTWDCICGQKGNTTAFCPQCGQKRPEGLSSGWSCPNCGMKNIMSNFCPNCGMKKPENCKNWDCSCGTKNIGFNYCPNCGKKREV